MINIDTVYHDLCAFTGEEFVLRDEPMSQHTTFRVGGPADLYVRPDEQSLPEVVRYCREKQVPHLVMGNGSNLLCGDGGIEGVVVEVGKRIAAIEVDEECVVAGAGALLTNIAAAAAQEGLTGFEFASGIPGSMGGAVVMNAGAYGGEMKDVLREITVLHPSGEISRLPVEALELSYRSSVIPERGFLVLSATLCLKEGRKADIFARMEELREERNAKQPLDVPSAGSTFKRPEGYFAGKLIEDAGLKGYRVGGAQVSEKHCGFVINTGRASAADIRALITHVQEVVRDKFGVTLEPEVKMIGRF